MRDAIACGPWGRRGWRRRGAVCPPSRSGIPPEDISAQKMDQSKARSVIRWVKAPSGAFEITGSEPPAISVSTVR